MEKKNRKLQLNKMTVAELNQSEQAAIYGGLPSTVTNKEINTMCKDRAIFEINGEGVGKPTAGTECARSFIGEANCNGTYTYDPKVRSCLYDCNTNYSICNC